MCRGCGHSHAEDGPNEEDELVTAELEEKESEEDGEGGSEEGVVSDEGESEGSWNTAEPDGDDNRSSEKEVCGFM